MSIEKPLIQHLDKAVLDVVSKYDKEFFKTLDAFLQDVQENAPTEVGELRIYDLQMAVMIATRM